MKNSLSDLYREMAKNEYEYKNQCRKDLQFFKEMYGKHLYHSGKTTKLVATIIKQLEGELSANTRPNRPSSANKKPIVWHRTGLKDKN